MAGRLLNQYKIIMEKPQDQNGQPDDSKNMTKQQVLNEIGFIMQQCTTAGNNDSEIPELIEMRDDVSADKIKPEEYSELLEKARKVFSGKIER
jgi:hypothetical protein